MPFDTADTNWRGGPTPGPYSRRPRGRIRNLILTVAAVSLALLVGVIAAAAVDGFPGPGSMTPGFHPHEVSTMAQVIGIGCFLLVLAGFVWWRVHRHMAK